MTIQNLRAVIFRRLLLWSGVSIVAGIVLILAGNTFWNAVGLQAVAWGAVDAAISLGGLLWSQRPSSRPQEEEVRRMHRILWISAGLDVLYVAAGLVLVSTFGQGSLAWRGHGWGIVAQGGFLFLFHLLHTRLRPGELPPPAWMGVQGPEHEAFFWPGGRPAALLVHGFPDTPAGMRPLGQVLHQAGWTVQGLLLPGFGPQIETISERRWEEWHAAILQALGDLRREHAPVLLTGYSLGGALSLGAAAVSPPAGLVLLAPFIWPPVWWQTALARWIGPFLLPYVQPFQLVRFDDPRIQAGVAGLFPHINLADPAMRERVRRVAIPFPLFNQVREASQHGYEQAARVPAPALIVQGRHDNVALPQHTRMLLPRLRGARYVEVEADHEVLSPAIPAWPEIVRAVQEFAGELVG